MSKTNKKYHIFEINVAKLNIICVIFFFLMIVITTFLYKGNLSQEFYEVNLMLLLLVYLIMTLVHELLHSLAYKIYGGDFKKIVYGAYIEKGVLYCLCKQNISRKNILNALMFPLFYIGIIPYIVALIFNLPFLLFIAIVNIVGSIGDIMMFAYIVSLDKDIEFTEFDNPMRFAIYTDKKLKNLKPLGLDYIETLTSVPRKDLKKVTISKGSYIALAIIIILTILSITI